MFSIGVDVILLTLDHGAQIAWQKTTTQLVKISLSGFSSPELRSAEKRSVKRAKIVRSSVAAKPFREFLSLSIRKLVYLCDGKRRLSHSKGDCQSAKGTQYIR